MSTVKERPIRTVKDLYATAQKAEWVDGALVLMAPTGGTPGRVGDAIFASLFAYARQTGVGRAVGDNKGFLVLLPHRRSFSPDAAYWTGPDPGMRFYEGAPVFAVEVRSEHDNGASAERALARKRIDYFAAGTQVVWNVDTQGPDVIRVYRTESPYIPTIYRQGDVAEAEPAVPGWTLSVNELLGQ